jgi:hypothetical protein
MSKEVTVLGQRRRLVEYLLMAMVVSILLGSSCGHRGDIVSVEAEARFRELFGSTLTDKLVIATDQSKYHADDIIDFMVENRTDHDLWFEDQSFGVQAFAYDQASEDWVELDLGFWISDPMPKAIEPGRIDPLDYYVLWLDSIAVPEDGKIRLVITGHTDLTIPAVDETYTAYADIEVVE